MDKEYLASRFSLDGKKAIVTGSSGGIGRAIAESLARFGAEVAVLGRDAAKLKDVEDTILGFGGKCDTWQFDIADNAAQEKFFDDYVEKHGAPDIFVANAGRSVFHHLTDTEDQEMAELIATDFTGVIVGLRRAGNLMMESGRGGNIVIVTSVNAYFALSGQAVYSGIKSALENICRSMATDLGKYGIRVNTLAPGGVLSDLGRQFGRPRPDKPSPMDIPLGMQGVPEQMGDVVSCMVSDAFDYMTGTTVLVDGGLMLRPSKFWEFKHGIDWRQK